MPIMNLARCGTAISRTAIWLAFFTLSSTFFLHAEQWDRAGAQHAFQEAQLKRLELNRAIQPSTDQYLECARLFRRVYLKDPHYVRAGDSVYEEGLLYQMLGDRTGNSEYYRMAVKRFQFLISDYGGNRNCPDALNRMGAIFSKHLNDEAAARNAYSRLRSQYNYAKAGITPADTGMDAKTGPPQRFRATAGADSRPSNPSQVQSIRYWSATDYTRVIIDMDLDARYEKFRLSNPDRLYLDITNARVGNDLRNRIFTVGDELLKQVRVAQYNADTVRVVLDLLRVGTFSVFELRDPFRIVIDLQHSTEIQALSKAQASESRQKSEKKADRKPVVGHSADAAKAAVISGEQSPKSDAQTAASSVRITEVKAQGRPLAVSKIESDASGQPKTIQSTSDAGTAESPQTPMTSRGSNTAEPSIRFDAVPIGPPVKTIEPRLEPPASRDPKPPSQQPSTESVAIKIPSKRMDSGVKLPARIRTDSETTPKAAPPTSNGDRTLTRVLGLKIGRIVIDPGHGGHDLGTIGPGGLTEKQLVLELALILKRLLQENLGAEVILTRSDDTFVPLEERTEIANRHQADLFISIHANSSKVRTISGVETYYLNFAQTDAEREVAARENATAINKVGDLEDLIKKIIQADKAAESRELASIVQKKLYSGARKIFGYTQNRGVRRAPFIVLIGANMPSVLAEVAFISNPKDERILTENVNREALARALYSGIEGYIKTLGSAAVPIKQVQNR